MPVETKPAVSVSQADQMFMSAFGSRGNTNALWADIAPIASPMDDVFQKTVTPGQVMDVERFDELNEILHERATVNFNSLTTPKNQRYLGLQSLSSDPNMAIEEQRELDTTEDVIFNARYRPKSGFEKARHNSTRSFLGWGTGIVFTYKGKDIETPVRYKFCHLADTYLIVDGEDDIVGVFYIKRMSADKIVKQFGEENVSDYIREEAKRSTSTATYESQEQHQVVHMVLENSNYHPEKKLEVKHMKYVSRHFVSGTRGENNKFLQQGGYRTMPYSAVRDAHLENEIYGRGAIVKGTPAILMRNQLQRNYLSAVAWQGEKPILFKNDSSINMRNMMPGAGVPGGIDEAGNDTARAMDMGSDIPAIKDALEEEANKLIQLWNMDLYISRVDDSGRDRVTALEIQTRLQEQARSISNHAALDESEMQASMVAREIDILDHDWNMIPKRHLDRGLDSERFEVIEHVIIFKSPIAHASKSDEVIAITRTIEAVQALQVFDERARFTINPLKAIMRIQQANGTPGDVMATEAEFKQAVKADQEQQAKMTALQNVAGITSGLEAVSALPGSPGEGAS